MSKRSKNEKPKSATPLLDKIRAQHKREARAREKREAAALERRAAFRVIEGGKR